jgi:hypothetical protein
MAIAYNTYLGSSFPNRKSEKENMKDETKMTILNTTSFSKNNPSTRFTAAQIGSFWSNVRIPEPKDSCRKNVEVVTKIR